MYDMILAFITAFTLTYISIPSIIHIAKVKNLVDEPGERRSHVVKTPSLGGIGIFVGLIFSIVLWTPFYVFGNLQYILCAFLIIFLIGAKDDIEPVSPRVKLAAQFLAAGILIYKSQIKITSLYGLFGINDLPEFIAIPLSFFTIIVIVNAFNLIDGINGLAGGISTLILTVLGAWFFLVSNDAFKVEYKELSVVAFATAGSVVAFLRYNITPAKIFMGDTGSLMLGLVCSILIIKFIEAHKNFSPDIPYAVEAAPAVAFGILIIPLFDTLRVFTTRMLKGRSPFSPDRTHIHHLLLDYGFSHSQASATLVGVNLLFIIMVFYLQNIGTLNLLLLVLFLAAAATGGLYFLVRKKKNKLAQTIA